MSCPPVGVGQDALEDVLNANAGRDYTVIRGDSPASIARKFGVSLDQLLNANPQKATTVVRGVRTWTSLSNQRRSQPAEGGGEARVRRPGRRIRACRFPVPDSSAVQQAAPLAVTPVARVAHHGLSTGAMIGIGVGVAAVVGVVIYASSGKRR